MIKTALAATALAAFSLSAHAVDIVKWDFESLVAPTGTLNAFNGVPSSVGTGSINAVHAGLTTFSTPAGNGSGKSFSANTWAVGDYWQLNFSTVGFSGITVSFDQTGSNTGPRDFTVAYSSNGTTFTNFASYSLSPVTWSTSTSTATSTFSFNLSGISALDNNSTVAIRLIDASTTSINGGTVASGGTNRIDNVVVATSPVPEASTSAMLAAGLAALAFVAVRRKA